MSATDSIVRLKEQELTVNDDILAVARGRLRAEADAVASLIDTVDDSLVTAASLILSGTGKLFIGGSGTSGTVARRMAHILSVTGTPSLPFSPMDGLHGASGAITAADIVLLISNGGASDEVVQLARIARGRGARVISLSRSHSTPLALLADHSVAVAVQPAADIGGIVATGITIAQSAWGDALAEVLMRGRGYTWAEFMTTHPAGAVGRLEDLPADADRIIIPAYREVAS
ncbi:SIS domain-containing protein [Microbacterium maritypicum]|uniref:SIS domain-containing protein n=2 Tax=Microbacterium maritypicum TaxID=33918 RepID=A0ACD4B622_MICMQ|nr:SIS domain-containing protein [Microbacterium liquefaciens]UTT52803.1 SIS domain-containing protein [Microbacterium liquefaciens]WEF20895.1 SIS domain-containing protein [Microbacterium liquefaciens]